MIGVKTEEGYKYEKIIHFGISNGRTSRQNL